MRIDRLSPLPKAYMAFSQAMLNETLLGEERLELKARQSDIFHRMTQQEQAELLTHQIWLRKEVQNDRKTWRS